MIERLPSGHIVDWGRGELRPAPRKNRPHRHETRYPVICPFFLRTRWLCKGDVSRAAKCLSCAASENGRKGFRAALTACAKHRLEHPSWAEGVVAAWLSDYGIDYERERIIDTQDRVFVVDFFIENQLILEVNGWGHKLDSRRERDEQLFRIGCPHIHLTTDELRENPVRAQWKLYRAISTINCDHFQPNNLEVHHV